MATRYRKRRINRKKRTLRKRRGGTRSVSDPTNIVGSTHALGKALGFDTPV